jgi:ATP-dependent RNA helicase DeaD
VHRIGRVGRAGREGVAITLAEPREHRMLKTIERVAGAPIAVQTVPTVADLRNRRLQLTQAGLRESLLTDDLDRFRVVVETLTDEFDLMEVALAAVKLAHEAGGAADDDEEIPQVAFRPDKDGGRGPAGRGSGRDERPPRRVPGGSAARVFVGAGRDAGIRPGDLVGAITGETGLTGRDIGSIEIHQRFALVEVPEAAADEVISALKATMIKGRKATIRRDRS